MLTLKASTSAMRKAGITLGVQEVESVMTELDEQIREVQDVTSALSNPLQPTSAEDMDLDAELDLLEAVAPDLGSETRIVDLNPPRPVSTLDESGILAERARTAPVIAPLPE